MGPFAPIPTDYVLDSRMKLLLTGRLRRRRVFPASGRGRSHALLRAVGLAATVACASVVHLAYIHKFSSCAWPRRPHSPRVGGLHPRALAGAVRGHQQRAVDAAEGHPVRSGARDGWWACYWQRLARCGGRRWPCGHLMRVWWPRTYEIRVYSLCAISSFIYSCTVMDRAIEIGSEGRSP